jgi:hypothetical protein
MIRLRLLGLALIAVLAVSAVAVSAAFAEPEFKPSTKQSFTGTSGAGTLEDSLSETISCTSDESTGEITGALTAAGIVVTFHGCKGKKGSGGTACTVKSTNTTSPGLIITSTLKGTLGLVPTSQAASGVGLLLQPESGSKFVEIEAAACASEAPVEGSIAGEVGTTKVLSKTGKLIFTGSAGTQNIKNITVKGKGETPALTAFFGAVKASQTTTEETKYGSVAVEVT